MTPVKTDTVQQAGKTKSLEAAVEPVESENPNGEFRLILSKDNTDRDSDNLWADEWLPLPDKIHMDSDHAWARHESVPLTVGSGVPSIDENGNLVVKGVYASSPHAQLTRGHVNEGHIWQASVSYLDHVLPDGRVMRELLNGTFTGVPANPEAVITESKDLEDQVTEKTEKTVGSKKAGGTTEGQYDESEGPFGDPKNRKWPLNTPGRIKNAWARIHQSHATVNYSASEIAAIKGRIQSAARRAKIDLSSDKTLAALIEGTTTLIKMKAALAPWMLMQGMPGHTATQDTGASSVYDDANDRTTPGFVAPATDGDDDDWDDDDTPDDSTAAGHLEWGDMHQSLAQATHDLAIQIRDVALQLGAQAQPVTNLDQNWDDQGWSDKALQAIDEGDIDTAKTLLEGFAKYKSSNPGAPTGPYQGVEGMSGENASGTNPGESIEPGGLFLKGTAGAAVEPEMKSVDTEDVDSKSLPSSTDETDTAADNKSAAASVSPADVAARARLRKFQFEKAILNTEVV